ncbi:hypothetical protein [Rhizobium sp. BK176]|uniref:hypothetical protein n=1 Tax=Rhizobium sp. BK176 TaxID=2587071 RepID=UPI002166C873|nr:hypothetical protein [Rhizobium sp. BK176]MCS4088519.1 hypothetical protein [Rhizobium sp. BK176]
MSDHTLGIPVRDLEAARKRAYALKDKADELGYKIVLAHTYELLGTAWGFKNWATVKAQLVKSPVVGDIQIGVVDDEPGAAAVRLPLSDCMNHVEIVSSADRHATQDFVLATASSLIRNGNGMFFAFTGAQKECITEVRSAATAAGREHDVRIINLNPLHRERKGWNLDIYELLGRDDLAALLFESMLGDFGKGDPLYDHRIRSAKFLTLALAALSELPQEHRYRVSARSLPEHLSLEALCDLHRDGPLPASVCEPLIDYLYLQGIDLSENRDYKPDRVANEAHRFYQEALRQAAGTHADMQKSALALNFDIAEAVREGKIIVALLPHPDDMDDASATFVRSLMRTIGRAIVETKPEGNVFATVLDGADGYLRDGDSGQFLETAKAANSPAFVSSQRPLSLPGLRGSAAIHVRKGLGRPLECVLVTDRERTEFVFRP